MNKILSSLFLSFLLAGTVPVVWAHGETRLPDEAEKDKIEVKLLEEVKLTDEGLYFEGTKGINYQFGKQITPHGDCIEYADGYVFVTWYKGGMDRRNLMLSRMKLGTGKWATIQFPDRHFGYQGDSIKGDSHNTAAIGVCPIDKTIHLIYDIHSYFANSFPNNYFNYRISRKNATTVPDSEWNISLFSEKKNHLNPDISFERTTYPEFDRMGDGKLIAKLRRGGSGKGNHTCFIYDGKSWSSDIVEFNRGKERPELDLYSIYGGFKYLYGKFHAGFSIRYYNNKKRTEGFELNSGLYYARTADPELKRGWEAVDGKKVKLPIEDPGIIRFAEPCELGLGKRISSGPHWTVTENDAKHFLITVNGQTVHYYSKPGEAKFARQFHDCNGNLFPMGDKVLMVGLDKGRPFMQYTREGTNDWEEIYREKEGRIYRHCHVEKFDDKVILYLMGTGTGCSQPIYLLVYSLR